MSRMFEKRRLRSVHAAGYEMGISAEFETA